MIIWTRGAPPLPHSFILLPGPATHGSNLPLQHHLVTTAVIQEAFTQMTEEEGGGEKKISTPFSQFFSLLSCNTTFVLWMVSQSCFLPLQKWCEQVFAAWAQSTNMTFPAFFYTTHRKSNTVCFSLLSLFEKCVFLAILFLSTSSVLLQSCKSFFLQGEENAVNENLHKKWQWFVSLCSDVVENVAKKKCKKYIM